MTATLRIALLLFGSGLSALVYQVAWLRELRLVFGASTAASAAVLAVFMGGLGLGGLVLGGRAGRARRPLALYARLELGVSLSTALTPLAIALTRAAYVGIGGSSTLGSTGGTLVRLVLSALVLAVPTFLMGGTLPAAAQAVESEGDLGRRRLAVLYGANTLGAVAGTLLSTFALLELLGTHRMLWSASLLNLLVALVASRVARKMPEREVGDEVASVSVERSSPFLLLAAAIVGFAFLLMELVWYRMLGPLLGGSSFTFGLILAVALAGIGAGGVVYALLGRVRPTLTGFAITCAAEAALIALPLALGDRVAMWASLLRPLGATGFFGLVLGWAAVCTVVVLPAAFVSGVQFPLLMALLGEGDRDVARQVGLAYAWNTAGAILGSLAGGFGLLPLLSAPGAWRAVVVLLAALGLFTLVVARRLSLAPFGLATVALVLLFARGPTAAWRHGGIGAGRGPVKGTPNALIDWEHRLRLGTIWEAEGVESSVALHAQDGYAFVVNGKVDGNARLDAGTQIMSGLTGAWLHPTGVKQAMVIGLGTGSTAGWLGRVPGIERVEVAELEPAITHVAKLCAPVNQDVLDNPKLKLVFGDAREKLLTSKQRYDLIFSEPSNPYRAGIASLFTEEFYRAAQARLRPHGLFVQWLQAYSVDAETVRSVYATLGSVFPSVESWVTEEADLLLVASNEPLTYDVAQLEQRLAEEPWKTAMSQVWRADDLAGAFAHYTASDGLAQLIAAADRGRVNTDDRTLVEFGFARNVGRKDALFQTGDLRALAASRGFDRPAHVRGAIDWPLVDERRIAMVAMQGESPEGLPHAEALEGKRDAADAWSDGDLDETLGKWQKQSQPPTDSIERVMLGEALAEAGDERARAVANELRAIRPVFAPEADAIEARLALRQERLAEAEALLERAFAGYRAQPWPLPAVMSRALKLATEVAGRDATLATRLSPSLAQPFAVAMLDNERRAARVELARKGDFSSLCLDVFRVYEPWPAWNRRFLEGRLRCYREKNDPLVERAEADLTKFNRAEPLPLESGLPPSAARSR